MVTQQGDQRETPVSNERAVAGSNLLHPNRCNAVMSDALLVTCGGAHFGSEARGSSRRGNGSTARSGWGGLPKFGGWKMAFVR
jgi:hypothetical protein